MHQPSSARTGTNVRRRSPGLAFAHLNLRCNPFGEPSRSERGALAVTATPHLGPGDVIQFLGAAGRGKTTQLLGLAHRHPEASYEYIPEGARRFQTPARSTPLFLLDEAQRLSRRERRRLFMSFTTLVIGSHEDLTAACPRPLRSFQVGGVTATQLTRILERRIEWARRDPGPLPRLSVAASAALIARYGDDQRSIEDYLYGAFQRLEEIGDVQV